MAKVFTASQCGWVKIRKTLKVDVWEKPNGETHIAKKGEEPRVLKGRPKLVGQR